MKKIKHLLEYAGLCGLVWLARILSLRLALHLGAGIGRLLFSVVRIRRRTVLENLRHAFPEKTQAELLAIAGRNYENFGMMAIEYLRLPKLSKNELAELIQFRAAADEAPWLQALAEGRGAICMTGHFGNWEYLGAYVTQKFPMSFLYQPQNNPHVDKFIRRTRQAAAMESIPRNSLRAMLRALREKRFVAILADQDAGRSGAFVDFMGRPASTGQGPAAFLLKSGAPLLMVFTLRQPNGRHLIESELLRFQFTTESEEEKIREITQRWTNVLEKYVRKYPDHWFWMHRRWKTPVPAANKAGAADRSSPAVVSHASIA